MSGREVCNKAANFCALLAQAMEAGAGEPGPGARLRQCEREFRAWARELEESPGMEDVAALRTERDALRARLDAQTKAAEEALARVKHIEWEMKGSPMKGEA